MDTWTLAFVVTPAILVAIAYIGVPLRERELRKRYPDKFGK